LQKLSNKKRKIVKKRKGLLLRLNMIGGYSRRLLGMRGLLLDLLRWVEGGNLEEEGEVGSEKFRRGERRFRLS